MRITKAVTYATLTAASSAVSAFGQSVISAKAGVIHYTEGDVQVGAGKEMTQVEVRFGGRYDSMKDGSSLVTAERPVIALDRLQYYSTMANHARLSAFIAERENSEIFHYSHLICRRICNFLFISA